jgi:purine-nucleoside/S-methyl-5'-thioadenosine phosphorylase / adenosine deaminase
LGEGFVGGVGDAQGDVFDAEGVGDFAGFAVEFYGGPAAFLADDLDVDPADAAAPAGAESFHGGFFGGEASGVALVFIFEAFAVFAFGGRVEAAEKCFAVALDGALYAADFGDVHSEADDQSFLRNDRGTDSSRAPDCDYTDRIVATKKTSPRERGTSKVEAKSSKSRASKAGLGKKSSAKPHRNAGAKQPGSREWTERKQRGVTVLQAAALNKLPWLVHGFSTRAGGVSDLDGEKVLNLGAVEWDKRENVEENRKRFQAATGASDLEFVSLHQIHSDVVRIFDAKPGKQCKGDALATNRKGLLLGVRTADCSPVLVVDPKKRVVAAIHAGWRGTLARIVAKTIGQMQMEFGSEPKDLLAAIGPTIGGCCYEVGTEVAADFSAKFSNASEFFDELRTGDEPNPLQWLNMMPPGHQPPPKKVLLDLKKANRTQLVEAGLPEKNIFVSELCTSCDVDRLFSYRKEGAMSGRLLGVIGIRG